MRGERIQDHRGEREIQGGDTIRLRHRKPMRLDMQVRGWELGRDDQRPVQGKRGTEETDRAMNRNIEDWKILIRAVFVAEDNIMPQWEDRLRAAKDMTDGQQDRLVDEYLTAIAEEILSKYNDEEQPN